MADPTIRNPRNVPGPVYVDDACIDCSACMAFAPDHFDEVAGMVVCVRQPLTDAEWADCREAADSCPVDAIGLDRS